MTQTNRSERRRGGPRAVQPVALVAPSTMASGTERRLAFVYRHLERRYPGEYRLILSADLFPVLTRAGFGLDRLPGVHVLRPRSKFDRKGGAHAPAWVNLGRLLTLWSYRRQLLELIAREPIGVLQPYLELVPFLGLAPIRRVPVIMPVLDHLPKYYDGRSLDSRLLLRALGTAERVDCLYRWIALRLEALGVEPARLFNSAWNCVNHEAFHPEEKDPNLVTFAARAYDWKGGLLMVDAIGVVLRRRPDARFAVLGAGRLHGEIKRRVAGRRWQDRIHVDHVEDPSPFVNRSLVHVSLDRYDNFPNQSLMEGMASGCAVVASDVGETYRVATDEVGLRVPLQAEAVAEAVERLLDDPRTAQTMGRAGRRRVLENHHVDRYIDYLRELHDLTRAGRVVDGVRVAADT